MKMLKYMPWRLLIFVCFLPIPWLLSGCETDERSTRIYRQQVVAVCLDCDPWIPGDSTKVDSTEVQSDCPRWSWKPHQRENLKKCRRCHG